MEKKEKKTTLKKLLLRGIPMDVYVLLLRKQGEIKQRCGCQYSLESTIYTIIRAIDKE